MFLYLALFEILLAMKEHCLAVLHHFVLLIILNKGIKDIMNI